MALFTEAVLKGLSTEYRLNEAAASYRFAKSADTFLREAASTWQTSFDVFLSHSTKDADLILGAYRLLVGRGLRVYVDWIVDPQMDRSSVTPATAEKLRERMRQSSSMVYVHSPQSTNSKWMPWELGYFDGYRSAVAIWPVVSEAQSSFNGQEYLGLYPWIDGGIAANAVYLWVNRGSASSRLYGGSESYKYFGTWLTEQRQTA